jgi:RNA polymerase sigma factor (TIGR02999 family)
METAYCIAPTACADDVRSDGAAAGDSLFQQLYGRLKSIAGRQLCRDGGVTLSATELVHELYTRMSRQELQALGGPRNFFAYAANAMRNIVIDRARHRLTQKCGGDWVRVTVSEHGEAASYELAADVIALNEALEQLSRDDARAAQVVELRYFAGLAVEQIAELMGVNRRTVTRDWTYARAFLHTALQHSATS